MNLRRYATAIALGTAAITLIIFAALSPLALAAAGNSMNQQWSLLSNIGQAYGAASALLSALAVGGVAISIGYQARANSHQRTQSVREQHREILRLLLEDPELYGPVFNTRRSTMSAQELRLDVFIQLRLLNLLIGYTTGYYSEAVLRGPDGIRDVLQTAFGRDYWGKTRAGWLASPDPGDRRFAAIADGVYQQLPLQEDPAAAEHQPDRGKQATRRGVFIGLGICVVSWWIARRGQR